MSIQFFNPATEDQYIASTTKRNMPKEMIDFAIEIEQCRKGDDLDPDKFGMPKWLPQEVWFNASREEIFHAHEDASHVSEFVLPHAPGERKLKKTLNELVKEYNWKWFVDKNPDFLDQSAGSSHVHASIVGNFLEPRGRMTNNLWLHGPMKYYCVMVNSMLPMLVQFPWWIFNCGRRKISHWAEPVWKPCTVAQVRAAFEKNEWIHYDLNDQPHEKRPSEHCDPYLAMQWNAKSYKATTLEIRISEQHPVLLFGILNGISRFLKGRIAQMSSFAFEGDVTRQLWRRWLNMMGNVDAPYAVLDTPIELRIDPTKEKLQQNHHTKYRKDSWETPLEFFQWLNLFLSYERMGNEVNTGEILTMFAHGLQPGKVPSYLLWNIPLLYEYTFWHGGDAKWCYKGGLLSDEEKKKHAKRILTDDLKSKISNDPFYMKW